MKIAKCNRANAQANKGSHGVVAAVREIKTAILRTRYMAARLANAEMLKLYFGTGAYVSANSREGKWGTGAIAEISARLQQELPGLRGFSPSSIKYMRQFFEVWCPPEIRQSAIGELGAGVGCHGPNRQLAIDDLSEKNFLPSMLDDKVRRADENPSIGIVLCREANRGFVEMAIRDMAKPMGVAVFRSDKRVPKVYRQLEPMLKGLTEIVEGQ